MTTNFTFSGGVATIVSAGASNPAALDAAVSVVTGIPNKALNTAKLTSAALIAGAFGGLIDPGLAGVSAMATFAATGMSGGVKVSREV